MIDEQPELIEASCVRIAFPEERFALFSHPRHQTLASSAFEERSPGSCAACILLGRLVIKERFLRDASTHPFPSILRFRLQVRQPYQEEEGEVYLAIS